MPGILSKSANPNISADQIRSAVFGANNNDEVYDLALKHNVSAQQIADAMRGEKGYTLNNINKYIDSRNSQKPKPVLNNVNNRAVLFGGGNKDISGQQIRDYVLHSGGRSGDEIINKAIQHGVNVNQITDAMAGYEDFTPENATKYLESKGIVNPNQAAVDIQRRNDNLGIPQAKPVEYVNYTPRFTSPVIAKQDLQRGTVAGQLNKILDPNSALMQRAQMFGSQQANRRGLLNSSLGVEAAQAAMLDRSLPIATADAASANQFALSNAQNQQQANMFNSDLARQYDLTKLGISKDMAINAENIARDYGLAQLDINNKIQIANINAASKSSSDAAGLNDRMLAGIIDINKQDISQEAKDQQIKTLVEATDGAIAMLGAFDRVGQKLVPRNNEANQENNAGGVTTNNSSGNTAAGQADNPPIATNIMTQGGFPLTEQEARNAQKLRELGHEFDEKKIVTQAEMAKIRKRHPKFGSELLSQWLNENTRALSLPGNGATRGPGPVTFIRTT